MTADYRFATLETFVGREVGVSPWVVVDQRRIGHLFLVSRPEEWARIVDAFLKPAPGHAATAGGPSIARRLQ